MKDLAILVVFMLVLNGPSCYAFYNVSCLPNSTKGILNEKWIDSDNFSIDSLEDVKLAILEHIKPDSSKVVTPTSSTLKTNGKSAGRRWRAFFVCSMTGEYELYFSCKEACEWFLMEFGDNSSTHLIGGNSSVGISIKELSKSEMSVNLTEGRAYYFEVLHYLDNEGHLVFRTKGPGEEKSSELRGSHLVAYREDGHYDTLHPGEWEAWSPCSTPCGPNGSQNRSRSCLTHPVMFNYSADGFILAQSRACNTEVMPCGEGCSNYTNITEPTRSVDTRSHKSSLCDKGVFTGNSWIRFTGSGGTTIPEYAPEPDHCGTENPGWVQGDHPAVAEGIVQRELCFRLNHKYCHFRYNVSIRNCGTFYVYKPPDILQCQLRICTSVVPPKVSIPAECSSNVYHELNESNRYWNSSDGILNCDNNTITSDQWYRFTGDAGTLMAPECVPMGSCNTFAPGWINGTHPANDYQLVSRDVCVHMQDNCCFKSYPVDIRNCRGYFVYKLKSPDVCYVRYCGMREGPPAAVTNIRFLSIGFHSWNVTWDGLLSYQSFPEVMGYQITYQLVTNQRKSSEGNVTLKVNSNITNIKVDSLQMNTTYCVSVLAYNKYGNGEIKNCTLVKTASGDCLPGWTLFESHCYLLFKDDLKSWSDAEIDCLNHNANLLYILSAGEEEFLNSQMIKSSSNIVVIYIGIKQNGGEHERFSVWSSGHEVIYTNWEDGPKNDADNISISLSTDGDTCAIKDVGFNGKWRNGTCSKRLPYICKRKGLHPNIYCSDSPIGMETGTVPDRNITASSYLDSNPPSAARLGSHVGWCPLNLSKVFLQVDLGSAYYICAVATQGHFEQGFGRLARYAILLSLYGKNWTEYEQKFDNAGQHYQVTKNNLNSGVVAQFVRFLPETWHRSPCLRVEIYGTRAQPFPVSDLPPAGITANASSSTSITVSWKPVPQSHENGVVLGYRVLFAAAAEPQAKHNFTVPFNFSAFEINGLMKFTNYCVQVLAFTKKGDGKMSDCLYILTDMDVPDLPPAGITANASSSTSIAVSWKPVPQDYANGVVLGYRVLFAAIAEPQAKHNFTVHFNFSVFEINGLMKFTNYCVQVLAFTKKGDGKMSDCLYALTDMDVPDLPPAGITANVSSSTSITVSWKLVPQGHENGVVLGYRVLFAAAAEPQANHNFTVHFNFSAFEINGLMKFTNYCVQVLAFTRKGYGKMSDCLYALTDMDVPDLPPAGITANVSSPTSIAVSWKPVPQGYENGVVLGYRVLFAAAAKPNAKHNFTVHFNISALEGYGLMRFTNYCVQALAFTKNGDGKMSDCLYVSTNMGVPSLAPSNLSFFISDGSTVNLSWHLVPEREEEVPIVGYAIFMSGSDSGAIKFVAPCASSLLLKNVSFSDDTCIQMAALSIDGSGILSDCATGSWRGKGKIPVWTYTTKIMSSSSIQLHLQNDTEKQTNGLLEGFYINYHAVRRGGEPVPDLLSEPNHTMTVCASATTVILTGLTIYTTYKIEVALITSKGTGKFSEPLYAETCRCNENLSISIVPNSLDTLGTVSLSRIIRDLVNSTCGRCDAYRHNYLTSSNITREGQISFPVTRTQAIGDTAYSKFVPVISVPGFVVVKRRNSPIPTLTKLLTNSIFESWPVCVLALLTSLLAGIIIWILDSKANPEHFPRTFFKGAGAGFWWSFITMSTVGYGDRCPQSVPAKLFAIVWFLVGLVIFALFLGTLTSLLTVTVVRIRTDANSLSSSGDGKVAVVANSSSHQVAVKKFPNKLAIGSTFPDLNSMVEALRNGNISSMLLDMYVPVKRKDLFNGSWFHVSDFLEGEIAHGILLQGEGVSLAKQLKNVMEVNNVEAEFLKQDDEATEQSEEEEVIITESTSVVFFEPSSPYFLNTMVVSVGLLLLAVTCGLFYQAFCYRSCCKRKSKGTCRCKIMKQDISESLEIFHHSFSQTYHRLRERQIRLLQLGMKRKRADSKESNTIYDDDIILARMY